MTTELSRCERAQDQARANRATTSGAAGSFHIRDRIRELRRVPARELVLNPKNWWRHPEMWVDALLAREPPDESLMLIDGHLRKETAPDAVVPVLVLDLDEAEADKLLITLIHSPRWQSRTPSGSSCFSRLSGLTAPFRPLDWVFGRSPGVFQTIYFEFPRTAGRSGCARPLQVEQRIVGGPC